MKRKLLSLSLALLLGLSLVSCGGGASNGGQTPENDAEVQESGDAQVADAGEDGAEAGAEAGTEAGEPEALGTLKVAATSVPHAEILEAAKPLLAEKGVDLVVTEYSDYVFPNTAVDEGDEDANYFQHKPYMDNFNEEHGTDLVAAAFIHYEPMGVYPGKTERLEDLPDGALISVPNDVTNEARALQLLAAQGLIEIDPDAGLNATPNDITSNPKDLKFQELAAEMLPNTVDEYNLSVINSNYAMQGGLNPASDSLASEDADSEAAQTFANLIAVKAGNENDPRITALVEVLT
ncbi:MAG: metal ABC transporter substrate-binding protein, partial [Oscillibacter sp.]|nr:metal ABC transporter substrate-binding protein [Oscillibacter sp.]